MELELQPLNLPRDTEKGPSSWQTKDAICSVLEYGNHVPSQEASRDMVNQL